MTSSFFLSFLWVWLQSFFVLASSNVYQQVAEFEWYPKLIECDNQLKACLITTSPTEIAIFDEETISFSESISVSSEPIKSMRILRHQQKTFLLIESEQTELILYALEEPESAEQEQQEQEQEEAQNNEVSKQEKKSQDNQQETVGEYLSENEQYGLDINPKNEIIGNPQNQLDQQDHEKKPFPKEKKNKNWWQKWRGWLKDKRKSFRGKVFHLFGQNSPKDEFFKVPNIELVAGSALVSFSKENTVSVRMIDSRSIQIKESPLLWLEWRFKLSEQTNLCLIQAVEVLAEKQIIVMKDSCGKLWIGNLHSYQPFTFKNIVHSISLIDYTTIIPLLDKNQEDDQILERLYMDDLNSQILLVFTSKLRNCLVIDIIGFNLTKPQMTQFPYAFRRIWENTQLSSLKVSHDKVEFFLEGGLILIHNFEKSKLLNNPSFEYSESIFEKNLKVIEAISSKISTDTNRIGAFFASTDKEFQYQNTHRQNINIYNSSNPYASKDHKNFHKKSRKLGFFVLSCSEDQAEIETDQLNDLASDSFSLKESSQYFFLDSMDCMFKTCQSILEENSGICKESQPKFLKLHRISQRQFFKVDDPKLLGVIIIAVVVVIILSQEERFRRYPIQREQQSPETNCEMKPNINFTNENQNPANDNNNNLPKERNTKEAREAMRAKLNQKFKPATCQKIISIDNQPQLLSKDFSASASSPNKIVDSYGIQSSPDQIQSHLTQQPLSALNIKRSHSSSLSPFLSSEQQLFEQQLQEQMEDSQDSSRESSDRDEQQWAIMSDFDWEKTSSSSSESYEETVRKIRCLSPPNETFDIHNFSKISEDFFNQSTATTASTTPLLRSSQSVSSTNNTKTIDQSLDFLNLFQSQQ